MTKQDPQAVQLDPGTEEARAKAGVEVKDLESVQVETGIIVEFGYGG